MHPGEEAVRRQEAVREICTIIKQCMTQAHKLSAGGSDIPQLLGEFEGSIARLTHLLSSEDVSTIIDSELAKLDAEEQMSFSDLSKRGSSRCPRLVNI